MSNTNTITNAAIVSRGYQAFNEADIATLDELFADNATWTTPGKSSVAGTARGKEAVFAQFGRYGGETEGTFRAELSAVFEAADGRVIGLHHNTGQRNGKQLNTTCCLVVEVKNGQIQSGTEHFLDLHNWDAFWS